MDQDGELSLFNEDTEEYKDMFVNKEENSSLFEMLEKAQEEESDVKLCVVSSMGREEILEHKISKATR
jgi:16S rRNA U1498 N3-methylase RsmE